ncbi:hypothetical protein HDV00_006715 [Rhizophlyctis rosea]|nr:hypothetical protein HDV00_006715 [Rhizophlyctis rosea]
MEWERPPRYSPFASAASLTPAVSSFAASGQGWGLGWGNVAGGTAGGTLRDPALDKWKRNGMNTPVALLNRKAWPGKPTAGANAQGGWPGVGGAAFGGGGVPSLGKQSSFGGAGMGRVGIGGMVGVGGGGRSFAMGNGVGGGMLKRSLSGGDSFGFGDFGESLSSSSFATGGFGGAANDNGGGIALRPATFMPKQAETGLEDLFSSAVKLKNRSVVPHSLAKWYDHRLNGGRNALAQRWAVVGSLVGFGAEFRSWLSAVQAPIWITVLLLVVKGIYRKGMRSAPGRSNAFGVGGSAFGRVGVGDVHSGQWRWAGERERGREETAEEFVHGKIIPTCLTLLILCRLIAIPYMLLVMWEPESLVGSSWDVWQGWLDWGAWAKWGGIGLDGVLLGLAGWVWKPVVMRREGRWR